MHFFFFSRRAFHVERKAIQYNVDIVVQFYPGFKFTFLCFKLRIIRHIEGVDINWDVLFHPKSPCFKDTVANSIK